MADEAKFSAVDMEQNSRRNADDRDENGKVKATYQNPMFDANDETTASRDPDDRKSRNLNPDDLSDAMAASICRMLDADNLPDTITENAEAENAIPLDVIKFGKWFNVIKSDDYITYDKIMPNLNDRQKNILLNGSFVYHPPPKQLKVKKQDRMGEFCIPLNISLASRSFNVSQRMLDDHIDLFKHDIGQANIIHVLIISASEKRQQEAEFLKLLDLVLKYLRTNETRQLLMEENSDGYRPLELAARLGVYGLFSEIINFAGHLVERSFEAGLNTYSVYNLSDYECLESRRRFLRSPLRMIAYTRPEAYESLKTYGIVYLQVIKRWYDLSFQRNITILFLWWFLRILFNCMMVSIDFAIILKDQCVKVNINDPFAKKCVDIKQIPSTSEGAAYFAVIWALIIAVTDIVEAIVLTFFDKERSLAYKGIRGPFTSFVAWTPFYRICQFVQVMLAVIAPFAALSLHNGNDAFTCLLIIKALSLPLVMMSILYIVEPLPSLGGFAIALQKMIESIIAFILFFIPVLITFALFFQSVTDPKDGFITMGASLYRLFMLEIGTLDFGPDPPIVLTIVHVTYYFVTGILLMNYLIAVMTSVINDTDEDREIMHFLRRLNLLLLAQERYGWWVWKLWYKIRGQKPVRVYAEEDEK